MIIALCIIIFISLIVAICSAFLLFVMVFGKPMTYEELKKEYEKIIDKNL